MKEIPRHLIYNYTNRTCSEHVHRQLQDSIAVYYSKQSVDLMFCIKLKVKIEALFIYIADRKASIYS